MLLVANVYCFFLRNVVFRKLRVARIVLRARTPRHLTPALNFESFSRLKKAWRNATIFATSRVLPLMSTSADFFFTKRNKRRSDLTRETSREIYVADSMDGDSAFLFTAWSSTHQVSVTPSRENVEFRARARAHARMYAPSSSRAQCQRDTKTRKQSCVAINPANEYK